MTENNIVYFVSTLKRTGPTNVLFNIIDNLDSCFNVTIFCLSKKKYPHDEERFLNIGVDIKRVSFFNILGIYYFLNEIKSNDKEMILHSHGFKGDLILSALSNRYIKVSTQHNYPDLDYVMQYGEILGSIMSFLTYKSLANFNMVVSCSKSIYHHFISNKVCFETIPIQNGINVSEFNLLSVDEITFEKEKLGIQCFKKVYLYLGAVIKRKKVDNIVSSFLKADLNDSVLIIVGGGADYEVIKEKCANVKNIKIFNHTYKPEIFYQISDCYISSSLAEGLPNAVMEAAYFGLELFLSNINPHLECNIPETNFFNPESDELLYLFKEIQNKINKSKPCAIEKFSAKVMGGLYEELYFKLIERFE